MAISIVDLTGYDALQPMEPMKNMIGMSADGVDLAVDVDKASFLDIFKGMVNNVVETNEQVDRDAIDIMLGNVDNLAEVQANITKANIAVEMLTTVKNEVLSAYNSIINMQI